MKNVLISFIFVVLLSLFVAGSGCGKPIYQTYNNCDKNDFDVNCYNVIQFKVCQLKQVVSVTKESNISGGWFLFIGGVNGSVSNIENFNYYTYVQDTQGGIYFMKIPSDKVRIYQDSKDNEVIICAANDSTNAGYIIDRNNIGDVKSYCKFNIHIPKGTIINKINNINIDNFVK